MDCCLLLEQFMELKPLHNMIYRAMNYSQDALAMHEWNFSMGKIPLSLPSFDIKTKEAIKADFTHTNNYLFNARSTSNNCSCKYM